jgi:hypothetical protein
LVSQPIGKRAKLTFLVVALLFYLIFIYHPMTSIPAQKSQKFVGSYTPKGLCQIVGLVCLAGFIVDMLVGAFPPSPGALEWRVGFLQQLGDRSIILLFGLALMLYSNLEERLVRKYLVMGCLGLGVMYILLSVLAIRDGVTLNAQADLQISAKASQIQSQLQDVQANPKPNIKVTPEQLEQAGKLLKQQTTALKDNATKGVLKTSVSSVGNLIVIGLGLLGLGQYGARPTRS